MRMPARRALNHARYALIAGLVFGLYFTLVGLGLNLVFGVMRIVNLAHGDFLMLGGFGAFGCSPARPAPAGGGGPGARGVHPLGLPIYYLLVPRLLRAQDPEMLSLILFFGLSQVIEALATIVFGTTERSIPGRVLGTGPVHHPRPAPAGAWVFERGRQRASRCCWSISTSIAPGSAR